MTPADRAKARREIVRVLRNLSTYHTDEDAADLILYALDCLAALSPAEPDLLARALWDCLVLSGADVSGYDGFEHWKRMRAEGMATEAVDGVRRLREDYDEACEEVSLSPDEARTEGGESQ